MGKFFSALVIVIVTLAINSSAQDTTSSDSSYKMHKCPAMGAAMGMMTPRVVANLQDGSILVMSGHQLLKYDSDLKLIQQVTVPVDTSSIQKMQRMCPGTGNMSPQR